MMREAVLLWIHGPGDREESSLQAHLESNGIELDHRALSESELPGYLDEKSGERVIGAIILPSVKAPVTAARMFFRHLRGREVIFLSDAEDKTSGKRDINLAFLYGHHRTISASDTEEGIRTVRRLLGQARRQRRFRSALSRINEQLAQPRGEAAYKRRLAISDRLLASILAQSPDSLFALDLDGYILAANAAAMENFGMAGAEGDSFDKTSLATQLPQLKALVSDAIRQKESRHAEMALSRNHSGEMFFEASASPVFDENKRLIGITVLLRDVTRLKMAEWNLRDLNEALENRVHERTRQLEEVNQQMEGFLYSIAHDLRAPIRSISGFTEILRQDYGSGLDETAQGLMERVAEAAGRMDFLIRDLLAYSRVAKIEMPLETVVLDEVFKTCQSVVAEQARETGAEVSIESSEDVILAHQTTLEQALINLLSNAIHYAKPGEPPHVRVSVERRQTMYRICVEDEGIGIDPEYHEKIFQIFERIPSSSNAMGTGVGLAIVKRGVERMGGRVGVESESGKGSVFWIEVRAKLER